MIIPIILCYAYSHNIIVMCIPQEYKVVWHDVLTNLLSLFCTCYLLFITEKPICELVDLTLVFLSLVHVARVVWLGWRDMVPDNFQWGYGDESFSQMSRGSLFFVRAGETILTNSGYMGPGVINGDFNPWDIPPQTIAEPPPNLSLSRTQASAKCSPRRQYARHRPSGRKRVNY
jgi:hypothetical protein